MSELERQQARFQESVLSGEFPDDLLQRRDGRCARLEIYQHAYRARLIEALRDNYPSLHRALGDDAFDELAAAYITARPSSYRSIRWFGDGLAPFVAAEPERLAHPALHDLIRLEWALRGAFDAADAEPLRLETLAALAPEAWPLATFVVHPSLQLLRLEWDVAPLWHALQAEDDDVESEPPRQHAHHLAVWRIELEPNWRTLEEAEASLLEALVEGRPFAELCLLAAEAVGENEAPLLAAGLLRRWLDEQMLIAVQTDAG